MKIKIKLKSWGAVLFGKGNSSDTYSLFLIKLKQGLLTDYLTLTSTYFIVKLKNVCFF